MRGVERANEGISPAHFTRWSRGLAMQVTAWCDRDTPCGRRDPDHRREVTRLGTRLDTRSPLVSWVLPIVEWIELS